MKAVFNFDLPSEQEEFSAALNGRKYKSALWHIGEEIKHIAKYETDVSKRSVACELRTKFYEILAEEEITDL